ncbi:unnamed protein product, partial [Staurois parvus]
MGHSQELSEFKPGTVIGCHLCNKSIRDIFLLLNIPQSTVSGIITKWKQLGSTATQPPKRGQLGQAHAEVNRSHQLSAESIVKDLKTLCGLRISTTTVSMAVQLHPRLTLP